MDVEEDPGVCPIRALERALATAITGEPDAP
jgi:hypothetical protein